MYNLVIDICEQNPEFESFEECANYYKKIINTMRQMNYSEYQSAAFNNYLEQLKNELGNGN